MGLIIFPRIWIQNWERKDGNEQGYLVCIWWFPFTFHSVAQKYPRLMIGMLPLVIMMYSDILKVEKAKTQYMLAALFIGQYLYFPLFQHSQTPFVWRATIVVHRYGVGLLKVLTWA